MPKPGEVLPGAPHDLALLRSRRGRLAVPAAEEEEDGHKPTWRYSSRVVHRGTLHLFEDERPHRHRTCPRTVHVTVVSKSFDCSRLSVTVSFTAQVPADWNVVMGSFAVDVDGFAFWNVQFRLTTAPVLVSVKLQVAVLLQL